MIQTVIEIKSKIEIEMFDVGYVHKEIRKERTENCLFWMKGGNLLSFSMLTEQLTGKYNLNQ